MSDASTQNGLIELAPGQKLDHFTIVEQLGSGGTAIVWKAYDTLLDREVAIKQLLLTGKHEDDLVAQRFRREAQMLKDLSQVHPRIVQVHELIDDERGAFIVMELVTGQSLEQLLAASGDPIDQLRTLKIIHSVANVLAAIHAKGIVHRDLKPSNLMLSQSGGVKVCDLGLAAIIAEQEALPAGSVRYMAPELFQGQPATPAADIYALGMIAYEMLAGRGAFNEVFKAVLRDRRNQAMRWMKWHTNPRAAAPPLNEVNPKVKRRFAELVARMMEKDLDKRVRTATELNDAINRHIKGRSSSPGGAAGAERAAPPAEAGAAEETAELPRRRRWPMVVAAVVLLGAVGVGGWYVLDEQAREAALVEQAEDAAEDDLTEAQRHYIAGDFAEAAAAYGRALDAVTAEGLPAFSGRETLRTHARAGLLLSEARVALTSGDLAAAVDKLDELEALDPAREVAAAMFSRNRIYKLRGEVDRRASLRRDLAAIETLIDEGDYARAEQALGAFRGVALADDELAKVRDLSVRLGSARAQGFVQQTLAEAEGLRRGEAIALLEGALERHNSPALRDELARLGGEARAARLASEARAAADAGDLATAIERQQALIALRPTDEARGQMARWQAELEKRRGVERFRDDDMAAARRHFVAALGYADDPEARGYLARMEVAADFRTLVEAGDTAAAVGDHDAAVRQYTEALKLTEDDAVRDKLTAARTQQELARGEAALEAGRLEEARRAFRAAQSLTPDSVTAERGLERADTRERYLEALAKGDALRAEGRFGEARRAYEAAAQTVDTEEVQRRLDDNEYEHLVAQGRAYIDLAQWEPARAVLRLAGDIRPSDQVKQLLAEIERKQPEGEAE